MSTLALIDDFNPEAKTDAPLAQTGAMQLLLDLEAGGALTATSLTLPPTTTYEQYEALGVLLGAINRRCSWYIGDWLLFGEGTYGERFAQAAEATGLAEQTLLNRVSVCRQIPPSRRQPTLSFSTHALVASLTAREQKQWLKQAASEGMTRAVLHTALKAAKVVDKPEALPPEVVADPHMLVEAARSLVRNAEQAGENVIVRSDDFARVRAALGGEED